MTSSVELGGKGVLGARGSAGLLERVIPEASDLGARSLSHVLSNRAPSLYLRKTATGKANKQQANKQITKRVSWRATAWSAPEGGDASALSVPTPTQHYLADRDHPADEEPAGHRDPHSSTRSPSARFREPRLPCTNAP